MNDEIINSDEVVVKKIIFRNEQNGWSVAWVISKQNKKYTMVGTFPFVAVGCWYSIQGQFVNHPTYGPQFKVLMYDEVGFKDKSSIRLYIYNLLGSEFIANKIISKFGMDAIEILDKQSERLSELDGVTDDEVANLSFLWQQSRYVHKIHNNLSQYGINIEQSYLIYNCYGHSSLDMIEKDPYCICRIQDIPFSIGDSIFLSSGASPTDSVRVRAIVYFALVSTASSGHCYIILSDFDPYVSMMSKSTQAPVIISPSMRADAISELAEMNMVVCDNESDKNIIYIKDLKDAEEFIAEQLIKRINLSKLEYIEPDMSSFDKELDESQKRAIEICLSNRISILTGSAGSGKTSISKIIMDSWNKNGINFVACCPTGMGTKQIEIKTDYRAKTIHRTFKFFPLEYIDLFKYEPKIILSGRKAILIDEISMVDIPLFRGLLCGLPEDIRIVMVGDPEQLPSVGPGNLLQDMIKSGKIPVAELTEPHRTSKDSTITENANFVRQGKIPNIPRIKEYSGGDMIFISKNKKEDILYAIKQITDSFLSKKGYSKKDIQILSPMRRYDMGSVELNNDLQEFFNPGPHTNEMGNHKTAFHENDRVIQIKNNYDKEVYNGDVGQVSSMDKKYMSIDFQNIEDEIEYSKNEMYQLELANVLSISKSQGTEYPVVILLCHENFGRMLRRKVYYTGITRAQEMCIIIGQESAFRNAIANDKEDVRYSSLCKRIINYGKQIG